MSFNENAMVSNRPIAEGIDLLIGKIFPVLDHGHIILMDYMGNDAAIVQAARTSYQAGTKTVSTDKGLLNYLLKNKHTTPFEMCEIKLHVRMPIFVARQWIRHRTASVNEMSARYSILPDLFYVPEPEHCATQSKTNRQGRGARLDPDEALAVRQGIINSSKQAYRFYEVLLGEDKNGEPVEGGYDLARELARMVLPTNFYTEWVWKIDLKNLLGFLALRADAHAQYEIRAYAAIILDQIVKPWVPFVHDAFVQHIHNAMTFTQNEMDLLCQVCDYAHERDFDWDGLAARHSLTVKQFNDFRKKVSTYGDE